MTSHKTPDNSMLYHALPLLSRFQAQLDEQNALLQKIRKALPQPLASQARHCLKKNDRLVIYMAAATWASQLRFYESELLLAANKGGKAILNSVLVKVDAAAAEQRSTPRHSVAIPSLKIVQLIEKESLTVDDPALQMALLRLSETLSRLQGN